MKDLWAARNPRERGLILLCVLAVAIAVPLALLPSGGSGKALLPASQARQKYNSAFNQKQTLEKDTDKLKPQIAKLIYNDPPELLVPEVIKTLQGYATASGVHLREIKPLRPRKIATVVKVPVSVRFTSDFGRAIPFLYRIEDPDGRMVVDRFNVAVSDPKTKQVDVEVQVGMYTSQSGSTDDKSMGSAGTSAGG